MLDYIIWGHPNWKKGLINIFVLFLENDVVDKHQQLLDLLNEGHLPISLSNIEMIPYEKGIRKNVISTYSEDFDLTLIGFRNEMLKSSFDFVEGYSDLGNILFVSANKDKDIE